jgi:hypothetical protein
VRMGWVDEQQHVLVTPDWWSNRRPVRDTDSAETGTDKSG